MRIFKPDTKPQFLGFLGFTKSGIEEGRPSKKPNNKRHWSRKLYNQQELQ